MTDTAFLVFLLCLLVVLPVSIFVFTHLRPFEIGEIEQLAHKRRAKRIHVYFSFNKTGFIANPDFKKAMKPDGHFCRVNESLFDGPSLCAAILKYKKHEWIVVAFERHRRIDLLWINKGIDRTQVALYLSVERIGQLAREEDCASILIFHNHPNTNPNLLSCRNPSQQDFKSAKEFAETLSHQGLNLIEFVCERGRYYEYFRSIPDSFLPLCNFISEVRDVNGITRLQNLVLHFERIFA